MTFKITRSMALSAGCALAAIAAPAMAQDAAASESTAAAPEATEEAVAEIVVTATKRPERLQDVPVAVSVVSSQQLASQNITSASDLVRAVPSLSGSTANASSALTVRGIGTAAFSRSAEGSVGVVLDGVALGNTSAASPQLFDLARVEVLEGPQGMLFGRNASAGLINVVTNEPDPREVSGLVHADIGSRNSRIVQGVLNLPVGSQAALRVSGAYSRDPDKQFNVVSKDWFKSESVSARARFKWDSGEGFTLNLIGDYNNRQVSGGSSFVLARVTGPGAGIGAPGSALDLQGSLVYSQISSAACALVINASNTRGCTDGPNTEDATAWGVSGQADIELGNHTLTWISAYRELDSTRDQDSDSMPINVLNTNASASVLKNLSQEIRLTSPSDGLISYVAGLYYFDSKQDHSTTQAGKILYGLDLPVINFPLPPTHPAYPLYALYLLTGLPASAGGTIYSTIPLGQTNRLDIDAESLAVFGQATVNFSDSIRGIAGFRYGREEVDMSRTSSLAPGVLGKFPSSSLAPIAAKAKDTYFSFKLGGQADLARDVMAYVTYTRGYKGPSTNDQVASPVSGGITVPLVVKPEIPHAWEAGIKSSLFGRRLVLNASLFHTRTTNFQAQFYDLARGGFVFANAPELTSKGFEVSLFGKLSDHLNINAGVIFADAKYGPGFKVQCAQLQTEAQGCITDPANSAVKYDDADGNRLPFSPKWKANLGAEFHTDISQSAEAFLSTDLTYTSRINFSSAYDPLASTGSRAVVGARAGVRSVEGNWGVSVWARNLFDNQAPVFMLANPIVGASGRVDPQSYLQIFGNESFRTVGLSVDFRF